jgi:AcrR family transcriptional regulator
VPKPSARDRLLTTAADLFYRDGIAGSGVDSVDSVVRESEVSKPTLYAHFPSKADLVAAVLEERRTARAAELTGRVPAAQQGRADAEAHDADARDGAQPRCGGVGVVG